MHILAVYTLARGVKTEKNAEKCFVKRSNDNPWSVDYHAHFGLYLSNIYR